LSRGSAEKIVIDNLIAITEAAIGRPFRSTLNFA
jgi:hypothetical protein